MEVEVATIMTVGVEISNTTDAIGTDKIITAEFITMIIGIMAVVMVTAVGTAGMNLGVITIGSM